jgi:multidrug efflux pump subunit AcrA (membrane-fusion protein)
VSFPATVTTVNPGGVITNGVASYQITVTFTNADPRIQSGLTANLAIVTATKDQALVVPESAIITNDAQKFLYLKGPNGGVKTEVQVGITSADGMTEITNGLSSGDEVLTFGSEAN